MKKLRTLQASKLTLLIVVIAISALVGCGWLIFSHAATPYVTTEPEFGSVEGCAASADDNSASGGKVIAFGTCQTSVDFTAASWNSESNDNTSEDFKASIAALMGRVDILGMQEMFDAGARRDMRDALLCSSCKYAGYVPGNDYSESEDNYVPYRLPIVWDKSKFSLITSGYVKVNDKIYGVDDATGTNVNLTGKWVVWVKLKEKTTGISFYYMNTHTIASVDAGGNQNGNTERVALYKKHMDVLTTQINKFKTENIPILLSGDFNVNYRKDIIVQYKDFPYARLRPLGMHSNWELVNLAGIDPSWPTQGDGSRIIDYVWSLDNPHFSARSVAIYADMYGSDHHPVVFRLTFTK